VAAGVDSPAGLLAWLVEGAAIIALLAKDDPELGEDILELLSIRELSLVTTLRGGCLILE